MNARLDDLPASDLLNEWRNMFVYQCLPKATPEVWAMSRDKMSIKRYSCDERLTHASRVIEIGRSKEVIQLLVDIRC